MAILLGSLSGGMQPSAPTIGTATGGDTSASVAFTASSYIGKGTITYTATSSPGGLTGTSATSPITVSGLTNGTAYTFTVVGNTNYGVASVASAASNSITPAPSGSFNSIASVTASGGGLQTISFTSIPSTYTHLQIRYASKNQAASDTTLIRFNNDSGSNYSYHRLSYSGSFSATSYPSATYGELPATAYSGTGSGVFGSGVIDIFDYTNTNKYKTVKMLGGFRDLGSGGSTAFNSMAYYSLSAISSIQIIPSPNWVDAPSVFSLYGIQG